MTSEALDSFSTCCRRTEHDSTRLGGYYVSTRGQQSLEDENTRMNKVGVTRTNEDIVHAVPNASKELGSEVEY